MPFCGNCGSQVPDGLKFCPNCGKPLVAALSPAQEPVQSVVQQSVPVQPVPQPIPEPVQQPVPQPMPEPVQNTVPVQPVPQPMPEPVQNTVPVQPAPQPVPQTVPEPVQNTVPVQPAPQPAQNAAPKPPAQQPKKNNNMPMILGIAGGVVALIIACILIGGVIGSKASAGDPNSLSNMLYQAAYNRQYTSGGSSGGAAAKTGSPSEGGDAGAASAGGGIAIADYASVSGSTYETDAFSVLVPDGWAAFPVKNSSGDGMDPLKLNLIKGGTSEDDLWTKNSIKIEVANYSASYSVYTDVYNSYEDVELKLGDYTYTGPAGEYSGGWECAMLSAVNGEGYVAGSVFYKVNDEVISLSDADVQAILASIKVK